MIPISLAAAYIRSGVPTAVRLFLYATLTSVLAACFQEPSEQDLLLRAQAAFDSGNARAAVIDVKSALQQDPDNPRGRKLLGEIYLFQQVPAAAVDEFERALRASEDDDIRVLYARALLASGDGQRLLELDQDMAFASVEAHPHYLAALALARVQEESADLKTARTLLDTARDAAPDDAYVATADAFFQMVHGQDSAKARATLSATLSKHPEYAEAWSLLGVIQQMSGELAQAETSYATVAGLNPYRLSDRLNLVTVQLDQGNSTAADKELKRLQASFPDHPGVSFIEGRMLLEAGDSAGSLSAFNRTLSLVPGHSGALHLAALANVREGNLATALGQLESLLAIQPGHLNGRLVLANLHQLMAEPQKAEEVARSVLAEDKSNYQAMGVLATALQAQGNARDPGDVERRDLYQRMASSRPDAVEPRLALAQLKLQDGDHAEAEQLLKAVREEHPQEPKLWLLLVDALMGQGKGEEAGRLLAGLPAEYATEVAVLVARGRVALAQGEYAQAETHLREAMEKRPENRTLLWLSGAVGAQGRDAEAVEMLNDWTGKNPDDVLVRGQLAAAYLLQGEDELAIEHYRRVHEQLPDNVLVLNNLAWLIHRKTPAQALEYIERAHELAPENPEVLDTYAMVQLEIGAAPEALALNRQALQLVPDDPQLLYHRALILRADGQSGEAVQLLEGLVASRDIVDKEQVHTLLAELQAQ